jgi:outer membrane protein
MRPLLQLLVLLLATVVVAPALAQEAEWTLDEVRRRARDQAWSVAAARADAEVSAAQADEAMAGLAPTLGASGAWGAGSLSTIPGFSGDDTWNRLTAQVSASWMAIDPDGWARIGAARQRLRASEAGVEVAARDAELLATEAFGRALVAERGLVAAQAAADASELALARARSAEAAGLGNALDLASAQAERAADLSAIAAAEASLIRACGDLSWLLAEPELGSCRVRLDGLPAVPDDGPAPPAVLRARRLVEAARADATAVGLALAPGLALGAAAGSYGQDRGDGMVMAPGWSVGISAELPLLEPTGWMRIRSARASLAAAEARLRDVEERWRSDLRSARATLEGSLRALEAAEEARRTADEAFALATRQLEAGLGSVPDWSVAKARRDAAEETAARATATWLAGWATLTWLTGEADAP